MSWSKTLFEESKTHYTAVIGNNTELGVEEAKTKAETALSTLQTKGQVETLIAEKGGSGLGIEYPGKNIAVGSKALEHLGTESEAEQISHSGNLAIGAESLKAVTTGKNNLGVGNSTLAAVTTGHDNLALGYESGKAVTTGLFNVALGPKNLMAVKTSNANVAVGFECMPVFLRGFGAESNGYNVAIGSDVMLILKGGCDNVAIGTAAMEMCKGGSGTEAEAEKISNNVCIGNNAGLSIQGKENTVIGSNAFFGPSKVVSGTGESTGNANTLIGFRAGRGANETNAVQSAAENVGIGANVFDGSTNPLSSGVQNVGIGRYALLEVGAGSWNVAIGYAAGAAATTGLNGCIYIGTEAGHSNTVAESLYIHNSSTTEPLIGGNFSTREFNLNAEKVALYKSATPAAQHATITAPGAFNSGTAGYANSTEAKAIRDKLAEVIEAIKGIGIIA